jgi:diaminohydroxyphosphoribosylaminopyrimidine deaminase/5-amino-6-(5-phosphoribosylamino)uracil reductase
MCGWVIPGHASPFGSSSTAERVSRCRHASSGKPERALVAITDAADPERLGNLETRGVTVLRCKSHEGHVDVSDLVSRLGALDVGGILVEGGGTLAWAFLEAGLVDRVVAFAAPKLLGGWSAPRALEGAGLLLPEAIRLEGICVRPIGTDWMMEADVVHQGVLA